MSSPVTIPEISHTCSSQSHTTVLPSLFLSHVSDHLHIVRERKNTSLYYQKKTKNAKTNESTANQIYFWLVIKINPTQSNLLWRETGQLPPYSSNCWYCNTVWHTTKHKIRQTQTETNTNTATDCLTYHQTQNQTDQTERNTSTAADCLTYHQTQIHSQTRQKQTLTLL